MQKKRKCSERPFSRCRGRMSLSWSWHLAGTAESPVAHTSQWLGQMAGSSSYSQEWICSWHAFPLLCLHFEMVTAFWRLLAEWRRNEQKECKSSDTVQSIERKPVVEQSNWHALSTYLSFVVIETQSLPSSLCKDEQRKACPWNKDAWYRRVSSSDKLGWRA